MRNKTWTSNRIALFSNQLAILLSSGISLIPGLRLLSEQKILPGGQIIDRLAGGTTFSQALQIDGVPPVFVAFISAAEEHGDYILGLEQAAKYYMDRDRWVRELKQASFYPCVILLMVMLSFFFMILFVLPRFIDLYSGMQLELPLPTRCLIQSYLALKYICIFVVGLCCVSLLILLIMYLFRIRIRWLDYLLKFSLVRHLIGYNTTYFIALQLGSMLQTGLPILRVLRLLEATAPWRCVREYVAYVKEQMLAGSSFSLALTGHRLSVAVPSLIQMVALGEQTGRLPEILTGLAQSTAGLIRSKIEHAISLIEPALIFVIGIGIALIVIALFLPMLQLVKTL